MDRIKSFSGSVSSATNESGSNAYGISTGLMTTVEKKEVLNNALVEFLSECGVDARYDGDYLWINGIPMLFTVYNNIYSCYFPFGSSGVVGSNTTTDIFNGNNYNFKVRLLGEPTRAFYLVISRNYTSPSFNQAFGFFKATNFINGRNSRIFKHGTNNLNIYAIDLDDDGLPIDIGRSTATNIVCDLSTIAVDYSINADKYPLVEWNPAIFKVEGCYYGLANSPLPAATTQISDAQTFIKLGDDTYYRSYYGPLIKCIS